MNETLIAMYRAIARDMRTAGEATTSAAGRFDDLATALEKESAGGGTDATGPAVYKKPNGRFTEAGVAAVNAAFAAGLNVAQVAKQFSVHTSAIYPRYERWKAEQDKAA